MKKSLSLVFVIGFALCFTSSRVQALSISLEPSAQTVVLGNSVDVAVRIADLGTSGTPPALSTFDLDISFDPGLLAFTQATFGDPVLGDQLDVLGLGSLALVTPDVGVVNLFELSFDLPEDLTALQVSSFTLATLTFGTTALGMSALGLTVNVLGDELGAPLLADVSGAMVTSSQDVSMDPVPEPGLSSCWGPALSGWSATGGGAGGARCKHGVFQGCVLASPANTPTYRTCFHNTSGTPRKPL